MPDPVITPAVPVASVSLNEGSAVSATDGKSVAMPPVTYEAPPVAGEVIPDAGEEADFVVGHHRFGDFPKGSKILLADVVNPKDLPALIKVGALIPIPKPVVAEPADEKTETPKKGK